MVDIAQITQWFNIGLLVLFLLIALGLFLAGLRGFRRGIWKSTHNMIFMLSLVLIAFITLNILTDFISDFDLSFFFKGTIYLTREVDGSVTTYYVPITSVKDTLTEIIKGFYTLYNVSASPSSVANFALALTGSVLKIIVFIVDMILIVTLGNFFSFITWFLIFQHFIPRVARKLVKLRWVGMIETAVTFLVVTFLFMTPFTSLVNSLNQSYQRNRPNSNNEMVVNVGNFVDAYNQSLFAQIMFNWTVDDSGMTLDTRLFDTLTTSVSGEYSIGLVGEFANLTNLIVSSASALTSTGDSEYAFEPTNLISKDIIDLAFDTVINSDIVTSVVPVVVEIAMNSDLLSEYIPNRLVDLSDVKWNEELSYVKDMVDCIFDSGAVDKLFITDENGQKKMRSMEGSDLFDFINEIVYSPDFNRILDIFKAIDNSKVLTRAVPALLQYLIDSDKEGNLKKFLPLSWEELNELSWGFETYILFDFLHSAVALDNDFLKAIFIKAGVYTPKEGEKIKALQTLISEHADEFKSLLVGKFDGDELVNVDKHGLSIVFENGQRIVDDNGKERNYCLFDMGLMNKVMPALLDSLFDSDVLSSLKGNLTDEDLEPFHNSVKALNNGERLINYKKEFNAILGIVSTIAEDEDLLDALMNNGGLNSLMKEENNFFSIDQVHINYFKAAIGQMDKSSVLYSALTPIIKSLLLGDDVKATLDKIGIKAEVMASAIDHDVKRSNHTFFTEFSSILDRWGDLNEVYSLVNGGDENALMNGLKNEDTVKAFVRILKTLHNNEIINPKPEEGDTYEENENLYSLLENVFSSTESMGLSITRDTLREVEHPGHTWDNEFDAIGDILYTIASKDITKASDVLKDGVTRNNIIKLRDEGPDNYDLPGLFEKIDDSYIFSSTLGPFLDDMFGESLNGFLVDKDNNVSFANITNWTQEGQNIKNLLDSIYKMAPTDPDKPLDLANFDFKSFEKVVDLNDMLHDLAHSGIFNYIDEHGVSHFQFGKWLYGKVDSSMQKFSVDTNEYDLLADPEFSLDTTYTLEDTWEKWGLRPEDSSNPDPYFKEWKDRYDAAGTAKETHYIAYKDFVYVNGMSDDNKDLPTFWCDYNKFKSAQAAFLEEHGDDLTNPAKYLNNAWGAYYASDDFLHDYDSVFAIDEISKVVRFMSYSMRVINKKTDGTQIAFNEIDQKLLRGILTSLNETSCMRISIYNFYRIAEENVLDGYTSINLNTAYTAYMVDAGVDMYDFTKGRANRSAELDKLMSLYDFVDDAKKDNVIVGSSFDYAAMKKEGFMDKMEAAVKDLNESKVFHRLGSSKVGKSTTFQSMFNTMLGESDIKNTIYLGDKSPKDANATNYSDMTSKIKYIVENTFKTDKDIAAYIEANPSKTYEDMRKIQQDEIHTLLGSIKKIYSLKNSSGEDVTNISDMDMNNATNRQTINELLTDLNNSELLYDLVPNTIYNLFVENDKFSMSSGGNDVDFSTVDPFYHYYYLDRAHPDYETRYSNDDINGIDNLLSDYQDYNEAIKLGAITDKAVLKALIDDTSIDGFQPTGVLPTLLGHLYSCKIFHSPARNYPDGLYYTNKFDKNGGNYRGYTLFEEVMSKICVFTSLDTFAYDSVQDVSYGSAQNKLHAKVVALSRADDGLVEDGDIEKSYYHNKKNTAWSEEINAFMSLAYSACNLGTGNTIDASSIQINKLGPSQLKTMLIAVNDCDMISDAVPNFIKGGFANINLGNLTTYNSHDYAVYYLGQEAYGGEYGLAGPGTEIDNIYEVMQSLNKGTDANPVYMTDMNDMTTFIKGEGSGDGLTGLLKLLYNSRIFNTSASGVYNAYNNIEGRQVSAQGLLLYNTLNTDDSKYILNYVARDANPATAESSKLDKISVLSKIFHMKGNYVNIIDEDHIEDLTYSVESAGLKKLITLTDGNLNATTFTSDTSINNVESKRTLVTGVIDCAYNATGNALTAEEDWQRSAIVSEIVSGVFNNILENQYSKLTSSFPTYQYETFSFGQADPSLLTFASYAKLNKVEKDGLDGILDSVKILSTTGANYMQMKAKAAELEIAFAKMGATSETNSEIARAVYLSEAHSYFLYLKNASFEMGETYNLIDNSNHTFNTVNELTKDPTAPNNIYSNSFSFAEYGHRAKAFLDEAHIGTAA